MSSEDDLRREIAKLQRMVDVNTSHIHTSRYETKWYKTVWNGITRFFPIVVPIATGIVSALSGCDIM